MGRQVGPFFSLVLFFFSATSAENKDEECGTLSSSRPVRVLFLFSSSFVVKEEEI